MIATIRWQIFLLLFSMMCWRCDWTKQFDSLVEFSLSSWWQFNWFLFLAIDLAIQFEFFPCNWNKRFDMCILLLLLVFLRLWKRTAAWKQIPSTLQFCNLTLSPYHFNSYLPILLTFYSNRFFLVLSSRVILILDFLSQLDFYKLINLQFITIRYYNNMTEEIDFPFKWIER